ncbi:alpha/beta hydrolase family protein [Candidatus Leptofilum sp.]|uniref:alpha/beta hydrolase family protein n=1 Tax=Candidatus Leptofilum sp. TaxID=3241576 RepID=UPI003B5C802A
MNKTIGAILAVIFLLILVVPVLAAQLRPTESRDWEGVSLDEVTYEEVQFFNETEQIRLAGMLFVPEGSGPFPAVVFAHGSAPSFRGNRIILTEAKHLLDNGIVVLVPDKRGAGGSEGDWETASFEALGTDAVAAVDYLLARDDLSISRVGIIGASQGGHISPLIASQSDEIDFIVNLSGASVPIQETLLYEEKQNLRQIGFLPVVADLLAYPSAWSIREVRQKTFWDAIGDFDPLPYWQELDVPALVLFGLEDTNVPALESEARLQALNNENITVKVYEGSGHNLETPLGQGNLVVRQEVLDDILNFIMSN